MGHSALGAHSWQVLISSTFYEQLFLLKFFFFLQFDFVMHVKLCVKLTTGVNFINVLRTAFAPVDDLTGVQCRAYSIKVGRNVELNVVV